MSFYSKFNHYLKFSGMAAILAIANNAWAIPAKPGIITYTQPDGTTLSAFLHGDESAHYHTTPDGYLLEKSADGYFHYVVADGRQNKVSDFVARDIDNRSASETLFIKSIDKAAPLENLERMQQPLKSYHKKSYVKQKESTTFPTTGIQKGLVILVEFSDNSFTLVNPRQRFHDQLNKRGYDEFGATGSALDYFMASSNGQFVPEFDVFGPVKLSRPMSYYGADSASSTDPNAPQMVIDACGLLDDQIDFSQYDRDNDGIIDNVYVFYAGYGQADGGADETVWPHSWDIVEAGYTFFFDGKKLNHYACSNELANGRGQTMAGIGVFCHEFSHVLGLPDLYATQYTGAFTPNAWTLMDNGSYNNECRTPPLYTGYERYCMGWVTPTVLDDPANVTMNHMETTGGYRDVYMIPTNLANEYYILENRQKTGWDTYIPGHGMLIWHIDYNETIWEGNVVNNSPSHQYVDIVEADNDASYYSLEGDAFPGTANVTSFTDETMPSMKTWNGVSLFSPITNINESSDGVICFVFKGGIDNFEDVVALDATNIKADRFTAHWNTVPNATSYLISVYGKNDNGDIEYAGIYNRFNAGNVTELEITGLTPLTKYYYAVYAFDGTFSSKASNEIEVTTSEPTLNFLSVTALDATNVTETSFTANWEKLIDANNYTLTVYTSQWGEPEYEYLDFTGKLENLPENWETNCTGTYALAGYCGESAPSLKMDADGNYLQSPAHAKGIRSISFWYRGNNASPSNSLSIQGLNGNTWEELASISPIDGTAGGQTFNMDVDMKYKSLKLVYNRISTGSIAIDDIKIGHSGNLEDLPLEGFKDIDMGNTNSFNVTGLPAKIKCAYDILAHNDEFTSRTSNRIHLTLGISGVGKTDATKGITCYAANGKINITTSEPSTHIAIYDSTGRLIANTNQPQGLKQYDTGIRGLAIVVVGEQAFKLIIR